LGLEALDLRLPPSSLLDPVADALVPAPSGSDPSALGAPPADAGAPIPPDTVVPVLAPDRPASDPAVVNPPVAGAGSLVTTAPPEGPLFVPEQAPPAGPVITDFVAVEVVGGLWRFTGDVTAAAPEGLTITFGGEPVSLRGETTTTDANGHFDMSKLMNTDGTDNGLATAQTVDGAGRASNVALYNINPG
jgi:hypothetical protein